MGFGVLNKIVKDDAEVARKHRVYNAAVIMAIVTSVLVITFAFLLYTVFIEEKLAERRHSAGLAINSVADLIEMQVREYNGDTTEALIVFHVMRKDLEPMTYAEAFVLNGGELYSITDRTPSYPDSPLYPLGYPGFIKDIFSGADRGETAVRYEPTGAPPRTVYIGWRWVDDKFLMAVGISKYTIATQVTWFFYFICAILILVSFLSAWFNIRAKDTAELDAWDRFNAQEELKRQKYIDKIKKELDDATA